MLFEVICRQTLMQLLTNTSSRYRQGAMEGMVIRHASVEWCDARAKLVRPAFTQAMDTHWRKTAIAWNRIGYSAGMTE